MSNRRNFIKATVLSAALASIGMTAHAADTIKVGVLHSLSGTMAISETALKETVLMTIDEINKAGGVMGKKLEPVVVDPASNWPLFAEKARQLLTKDKVAVTFGCWTSVSRKSVLPVYKELNGLLFYPVQYEGEELEKNVFYTGAAPNQQAIPAVEYLMSKDGGEAKRFVLLGTDYVYPRTTNKILRAFLKSKGVADADIMEDYTPFGHSDYQTIIAKIKKFASEGKKTAVVSTINGDSNVPFYKELGNAGLKATDVPVVAFSVGEEELRGVDTKPLVGHLASWNYFMSLKNPGKRQVREALPRLGQEGQAAERRQGRHQRPDGSHLHRHPHVEAGRREGQVDRYRQGHRRHGWPDLQGTVRHHVEDGREEPPPAQVGVHRRSEGRRSVQRRLEDARPGQGPAVEPVHHWQRQEEGRAGNEVIRFICQSQTTGASASVFGSPGRK
jgi:urea transport system substrate-binding protein